MAARTAMLRMACLIVAVCAACLSGCDLAPRPPAKEAPEAPAAPSPAPPAASTAPEAPTTAPRPRPNGGPGKPAAQPAPKRDTAELARKRAPEKAAEAAPPAPVASAALSADEERMRKRDAYVTGLRKAAYTFNPPSPIKVEQRVVVSLWLDPSKETEQLAEEMRKSLPDAGRIEQGTTTWSPRMRATLTGADFEIMPVEGKDFDGVKDLSMTARTEWGWAIVPKLPGKKQMILLLSIVLPPELGEPRELPALQRPIEVEVTLWWLIDHYWEKYWQWMLGGLASAVAAVIAWWGKKRFGGEK